MHSFTHPCGPIPKADWYAWPGGYPIIYIMDDGETLCADCMNDPSNPAHFGGYADGWRCVGRDIHYEGADEICANCNRFIPSAYGNDDPDFGEGDTDTEEDRKFAAKNKDT